LASEDDKLYFYKHSTPDGVVFQINYKTKHYIIFVMFFYKHSTSSGAWRRHIMSFRYWASYTIDLNLEKIFT